MSKKELTVRCQRCGSTNIRVKYHKSKPYSWECKKCGYKWKQEMLE